MWVQNEPDLVRRSLAGTIRHSRFSSSSRCCCGKERTVWKTAGSCIHGGPKERECPVESCRPEKRFHCCPRSRHDENYVVKAYISGNIPTRCELTLDSLSTFQASDLPIHRTHWIDQQQHRADSSEPAARILESKRFCAYIRRIFRAQVCWKGANSMLPFSWRSLLSRIR